MITGYIKGNIVELFMKHECDIAHGCNCFTTMGAGVAGQLAKAYPPILDIDIDEDRYYDNNLAKLGTHTRVIHKKAQHIAIICILSMLQVQMLITAQFLMHSMN